MSDEATAVQQDATPAPTDAQPTGAEPGQKTEAAKTFTQEQVDALIKDRLQREARKAEEAATKARTEAERKAAEEQGEFRKLAESLKAELEQERQRARTLEIAGIRRDVASRLNLPAGLVDRLRGDTEDEITADAQALIAALPKPPPPNINAGDAAGAGKTLPAGLTEDSIRQQAVRLGVPYEAYRAVLVNGR